MCAKPVNETNGGALSPAPETMQTPPGVRSSTPSTGSEAGPVYDIMKIFQLISTVSSTNREAMRNNRELQRDAKIGHLLQEADSHLNAARKAFAGSVAGGAIGLGGAGAGLAGSAKGGQIALGKGKFAPDAADAPSATAAGTTAGTAKSSRFATASQHLEKAQTALEGVNARARKLLSRNSSAPGTDSQPASATDPGLGPVGSSKRLFMAQQASDNGRSANEAARSASTVSEGAGQFASEKDKAEAKVLLAQSEELDAAIQNMNELIRESSDRDVRMLGTQGSIIDGENQAVRTSAGS